MCYFCYDNCGMGFSLVEEACFVHFPFTERIGLSAELAVGVTLQVGVLVDVVSAYGSIRLAAVAVATPVPGFSFASYLPVSLLYL